MQNQNKVQMQNQKNQNKSNFRKLLTVSNFYKEIFGTKVYKISIDAGCTCPNRDGTKSTKGCIFCSEKGSGDFTASRQKSIKQQISDAKELLSKKLKNKTDVKYIAYFQNFTNTYGNPEILIKKYNEAIESENIAGIAIATRPDCLGEGILKYLGKLAEKMFVQLELGFQSSKLESESYINRCFSNKDYSNAVKRVKTLSPKIHVVTHIIFGIPGETKEDMLNSVKYCLNCGTDGIKFTVLYVLKNTILQKEYEQNKFECLTMNSYFDILCAAISLIPENIVIHRLTGDGPKALLIAPVWTEDKKNVHNQMKKYFFNHGIILE